MALDHDSSERVVVFCSIASAIDRVRTQFPTVDVIDISNGEIPPGVRGEVLFGNGSGPAAIEAMRRGVRWVQMVGAGIDGRAPEVCSAPFVTVARGASAIPTGEYVIASMGAFARHFPENWLHEPPEQWHRQAATTLAGKTLGLFGLGGIGQRIARIALAMEMSVFAVRRRLIPSPIDGVEIVASLSELATHSDHIVLAAPATERTVGVVNDDLFSKMRKGVHLVNIARGTLVDQDALRRALDNETVARASLDVTDPEPLPAGHWLFEHPKVFLTPHSSTYVKGFQEPSITIFCDNLERYLAGEPLQYLLEKDGY